MIGSVLSAGEKHEKARSRWTAALWIPVDPNLYEPQCSLSILTLHFFFSAKQNVWAILTDHSVATTLSSKPENNEKEGGKNMIYVGGSVYVLPLLVNE